MGAKQMSGVWVLVCDWVDENGQPCNLGRDGEPRTFVDPDGGRKPDKHFQCGAHHGVVKQEYRPEFQLPEGHKLKKSVLRPGENLEANDE